ncbi:DUF6683 family protein [Sphingosinicella sp. BN140058]|uniref:DUF6683 family protein n=1 Tax=Sphingosinicella sp. BN140058 TaxID=1892855 RepID=UPI0010105667|nr:DUF6683 family protein [Sphingosinicella sp. BN140058]QAY75584.1 hypothetical protein ETR14_02850 [Sphingosinicella sp. BN140058]
MKRALALLVALGLCGSPATAQNMGWSTIIPSVTGTDTLGLTLRGQMQGRNGGARAAGPRNNFVGTTGPAPTAVNLQALRYKPSKQRRAANLAAFVAKTRAVDQGNAADMQRLFASGDFIDKVGGAIAPLGLRVDNIADAYAIWWISAWNATRGNNDSPSRAMSQAVSAQAARAIGATPEIVGADDAAKQEFAEALLIQMSLVDTAVEQNKNNPAQLRALGSAVAQGAEQMGIDLSAMQLTENGFVPAGGADAAPANQEKGKQARLAGVATTAPDEDGKPLPYGLAAAAAGLGAGGWMLLRRHRA